MIGLVKKVNARRWAAGLLIAIALFTGARAMACPKSPAHRFIHYYRAAQEINSLSTWERVVYSFILAGSDNSRRS
jgi:hypothetical protein